MSKAQREIACISYSISLDEDPMGQGAEVTFRPYLDGDVRNEDANYGENFWLRCEESSTESHQLVTMETKKSHFRVAAASSFRVFLGDRELAELERSLTVHPRFAAAEVETVLQAGETLTVEKTVAVTTNRDHRDAEVSRRALEMLQERASFRYSDLFQDHSEAWHQTWRDSDIVIEGDSAAQQGIRFNIFHLHQTYTGEDPRLNIGPKGFTGEKYGGSTYWDTEAYCLPFYLSTSDPQIPRNLLLYRYHHLEKAKENAEKLGLKGALTPWSHMTGEECHNEWRSPLKKSTATAP